MSRSFSLISGAFALKNHRFAHHNGSRLSFNNWCFEPRETASNLLDSRIVLFFRLLGVHAFIREFDRLFQAYIGGER